MAEDAQSSSAGEIQQPLEVPQGSQAEGNINQNPSQGLPPPVPPVPNQPPANDHQQQAGNKNCNRLDIARFIVEFITLAVLLWYTIITNDLWREANDANRLNTENSRLDQRPWVFVVEVPVRMETNQLTGFPMNIVNNGRTPAFVFETSHTCTVAPLLTTPRYAPKPNNMIIPPGPPFEADMGFKKGLPEDVLNEVREGKKLFRCYGYYKYRDWWGEEHITGYALRFNHAKSTFNFDPTPNYTYAK